eukprot:TRINITY_DN6126_c0_g1_i1.p1 TRINITY_DN6126_c0_g1~~TRINITY_DN6126_c0_g1_i1.p1  ORF type:complete len:338 (-),score=152.49 TRINITY_DN6126_c0_g1_i1:166-1044(-)
MKSHTHLFGDCWVSFLKLPIPVPLYKGVLSRMHGMILAHIPNPLLLMDFLTDSYNIGGVVSILALSGLFVLISQHNLEYPEFYEKLYALFEPSVFYMKHRAHLFSLSDLFMSSTHLPAYIVAAFAKRVARLCLAAPPSGCLLAIPFVYNLLHRHPSCRVLLHAQPTAADEDPILFLSASGGGGVKKQSITSLEGFDRFDATEKDPAKCNALQSSLWEITALRKHSDPSVVRLSSIFEGSLEKKLYNLTDFAELSYHTEFAKYIRKRPKEIPLAIKRPECLFGEEEASLFSEV